MASFSWPWSRNREKFSSWSISDPAFASWWAGAESDSEIVSASTVLGLSAALRATMIISGTIATLPLRTYERDGDDRHRIESVFDDPYAGVDGMTVFEWVETVLLHDVLWRNAYLWHENLDREGFPSAYRPLYPEAITKVERVNGKKRYSYREDNETKTVGSERITHIPGPSVDGVMGFSILLACRRIFSGAISGDKAAQTTLKRGIRIAGLVTPEMGEEFTQDEGEAMMSSLRARTLGSENAGDIAMVNRRLKLTPWTPTNVESQWHETRTEIIGEIGRIFGVPPHLLGDTEKQTSWGTGVAEQNLGLARYTLMPWSSRVEQRLSQRLPRGQFVEFDYKGLLQGAPAAEIELLIEQKDAGVLEVDEVRKVLNLPPLTAKQRASMAPPPVIAPTEPAPPVPVVSASRVEEPNRTTDLTRYAEIQQERYDQRFRTFEETLATLASREPIRMPDIHVDATTRVEPGAVQVATPDIRVDATTTIADGAFRNEPAVVNVAVPEQKPPDVTVTVEATTIPAPVVNVAAPDPAPIHVEAPVIHNEFRAESPATIDVNILSTPPRRKKVVKRDQLGRIETVTEE